MTLEECKSRFGAQITPHFRYWELIYSKTAEALNIDNNPPDYAYHNLEHLAARLLEPLRVYYGKPIAVAGKGGSGYRCDALNEAVGGSKGSHHRYGLAADCHVDKPLSLLKSLLKSGLDFDQAIVYPWGVHISLKLGANRRQVRYNKTYTGKHEIPALELGPASRLRHQHARPHPLHRRGTELQSLELLSYSLFK